MISTMRWTSRPRIGAYILRYRAGRMSFHTKVLPVKADSIVFGKYDEVPTVTDAESAQNLRTAADELTSTNNVVGFPTETVYGLAGLAVNDESVRSIYRAKNRPADNPLIVHVSSISQLKRKILPPNYEIPETYTKLMDAFWPGPMTILLPVHDGSPISKLVTVNQPTVAVRIPSHPIARALIALSDTPLAAPSANASTRPSPTLASHVLHDLNGKIPYIIDGGPCSVGVESTVVDGLCDPPMLLRPGGVSAEQIRAVGGDLWKDMVMAKKTAAAGEQVRTPGMKYRHYSPTARVVLFVNSGDGIQAVNQYFEQHSIDPSQTQVALLRASSFARAQDINSGIAVERDLGETAADASRNLFRLLREVDEMGVLLILVEGIEESNEGLAVMNRLSKAAYETVTGK